MEEPHASTVHLETTEIYNNIVLDLQLKALPTQVIASCLTQRCLSQHGRIAVNYSLSPNPAPEAPAATPRGAHRLLG